MITLAQKAKKPENSSPSGEHPAVKEYRRKLDSVSETSGFDSLDQAIQEYLREVKTPVPPKPDGA